MTGSLPPPSTLLGIPRLTKWYGGQEAAFRGILDWYHGPARFLGLACPTGGGKSILALLAARMTDARTLIVTATKGLQGQYISDAAPLGGVIVKGQSNFPCTLVRGITADEGPCHEGLPCTYAKSGGCPYREQLVAALSAPIVITNYAYYLAQTRFSSGMGEFGLLILDEGHLAFSSMESHLTIFFSKMDVESLGVPFPVITDQWELWRSWAETGLAVVEAVVSKLESDIKARRTSGGTVPGAMSHSYHVSKSVSARMGNMVSAQGDWVIQKTYHGWRFTPKWVSGYNAALFQSTRKVMLMSAILSAKTADSLGVPVAPDRSWIEVPSYFPPRNTPIWHVPTARINFRTDDYGSTIWVTRIDQIISRRQDRKGIIFTVSYDRARLLLQRSRYANIMLTHSTNDVVQVVEKFKRMDAPAVLVSPTVTTGWDFPAELYNIRYIIVGKVPYPDTKDPVMQARQADDKEWSSYLAMETVIQESGRATRSSTDKCEILIVDDQWKWFYWQYKKYAPLWFQARVRGSLTGVPDPLI